MKNSKENSSVSNRNYGLFILLSRQRIAFVGYSHDVWAGDLDKHKSTSRYSFLLNNGANLWKRNIALLTIEVEFTICSIVI